MRDLLMRAHRIPRGMLIVGEGAHSSSYYYTAPVEQPFVRRLLSRARVVR